jgi:hypothetical protein
MPNGVSPPEDRAKWVERRGQAIPRDPRQIRALSADVDKAQAEGVELTTAATASEQ